MPYQWDSTLESGYEVVDRQHKQLIGAHNNLINAVFSGKGDRAVLDTLDFLIGYVTKHFADEEHLQIEYDYPDYLNHKRIHDEFKITVGEFVDRVNEEGPTTEIINALSEVVSAWLFNHIRGDDFRMAAFVKSAETKSSSSRE